LEILLKLGTCFIDVGALGIGWKIGLPCFFHRAILSCGLSNLQEILFMECRFSAIREFIRNQQIRWHSETLNKVVLG
jgi:hypothetical protein